MDFYKVRYGDQLIGYLAPTNIWPADDYRQLSALYDKAKTMLVQVMQDVPPLPTDYDFGDDAR